MMIDVRLADGRTTLRFWARGHLVRLIKRKVEDLESERWVKCFAKWHTDDTEWTPAQMTYLRANSIAFVRVVPADERQAFEQQYGSTPEAPTDATRIADTV